MRVLKGFGKFVLVPVLFYFVCWVLFSWPVILKMPTHLFAGHEDGLQNYWSMWWVNKTAVNLNSNYWFTPDLYYPFGVNLIGHALSPLNGIISIPLSRYMPLFQAYNLLLISSFVLGGLFIFWLFYALYQTYVPALFAGFVFTFSPNHFAQAQEHMEMLAFQWIALYALLLLLLIKKPNIFSGMLAALALHLLLLDTPYFFLNGLLLTVIFVGGWVIKTKNWKAIFHPAILMFGFMSLILNVGQFNRLYQMSFMDPLSGSAPAEDNSLDFVGYFIPGRIWRWGTLTQEYAITTQLITERGSQYLGWSIIGLLGLVGLYSLRNRTVFEIKIWWAVFGIVTVLAWGPTLRVWEHPYHSIKLPYYWLEKAVPPLQDSGKPVRMMVLVTLAVSMLSGYGVKLIWRKSRLRWLGLSLWVMYAVEVWPIPQATTFLPTHTPPYIEILRKSVHKGSVLDEISSESISMYQQTVHQKPLAEGYLARYPLSISRIKGILYGARMSRDFFSLCHTFNVRYFITTDRLQGSSPPSTLYDDGNVRVYDLGTLAECREDVRW